MVSISDPRGFRKTVAGICMIGAPAFLAVGELIHPRLETEAAAQLEVLRENADRQYAAHMLFLVSLILVIPALLGLMHMLKARRPALGHVGTGLAIVGSIVLAVFVGTEFVTWQVGKAAADDTAAMTALLDRLNESAGVLPLVLLAITFPLGLLVLGIGLWQARTSARWEAVLVGVAPVVTLVSEFSGGPRVVTVGGAVLFLLGLGSIGRRVLAYSDEEWEQAPEVGALRSAVGTP